MVVIRFSKEIEGKSLTEDLFLVYPPHKCELTLDHMDSVILDREHAHIRLKFETQGVELDSEFIEGIEEESGIYIGMTPQDDSDRMIEYNTR